MDLNCQNLLVDIHTHRLKSEQVDTIQVQNRFYQEKSITSNTNAPISIGLHPWHIDEVEWDPEKLADLASKPYVIAIGEIGVDKLISTTVLKQIELFRDQAQIANDLGIPIIIHCVKAFSEILEAKKHLQTSNQWILHGFRGKPALAHQLLDAGIYLSFGESLLIPHSNSSKSLKETPLDSLFLETDESDINIEKIYDTASIVLEISKEELKYYLYKNFKEVFRRHE